MHIAIRRFVAGVAGVVLFLFFFGVYVVLLMVGGVTGMIGVYFQSVYFLEFISSRDQRFAISILPLCNPMGVAIVLIS